MPHSTSTKLTINELHPTFGAEVYGVDFSQPIDDETFQEIYDAITKVRPTDQTLLSRTRAIST